MRVLAITESGQSHRFKSAQAFEAWRLHAAPGQLRVITFVEVESSGEVPAGVPLPAPSGASPVPAS